MSDLNEKLVEEAAEVSRREPRLGPSVRAAIEHYLTNRRLPERMRDAAETIHQFNDQLEVSTSTPWGPQGLRDHAARIESADGARDDLVEELARRLYCAHFAVPFEVWDKHMHVVGADGKDHWRDTARQLLEHFGVELRGVS